MVHCVIKIRSRDDVGMMFPDCGGADCADG